MKTPRNLTYLITALLLTCAAPRSIASDADWSRSFGDEAVTWLGLFRGHGIAVVGNQAIVFDPMSGVPTDTLQGPDVHILAALVRYDLDKYYMVVKSGWDIPGELRIYTASTGTLDTTISLRYPLSYDNGFGPVAISDDAKYIAVSAHGIKPNDDPRQNNTYGSSAFIWDVDADSMKFAYYSERARSVRFLRSEPWVRVDRFGAYDLKGDSIVWFKRELGVLSHDALYHRVGLGLRIGLTADANDDDLLEPHDADLQPYNVRTSEWVIGHHIVVCFPDTNAVKTDTTIKIFDISRNDTLLVCDAPGARAMVAGGFTDSSTVLVYFDDGNVRKWSLQSVDLEPSRRLVVNPTTTFAGQYEPFEVLVKVFPNDTSVTTVVDWGDGKSDPSICHSYDSAGTHVAQIIAYRGANVVDSVSVPVTISAYQPQSIEGAVWTSAVPGYGAADLKYDSRLDRLLVVVRNHRFDHVKVFDAVSGSTMTSLKVNGTAKSLFVAGDTATYILTAQSTSIQTGNYDTRYKVDHYMTQVAYGQRRPAIVANVASNQWSSNRGRGPDWGFTHGQPASSPYFIYGLWVVGTGGDVYTVTSLIGVSDTGEFETTRFDNPNNPGKVVSACSTPSGDTLLTSTFNIHNYTGNAFNSAASIQSWNPDSRVRLDSLTAAEGGMLSWIGHHHLLSDTLLINAAFDEVVDTLPAHQSRAILPRGYAVLGTSTHLHLIDVFRGDTLWSKSVPSPASVMDFDEEHSQLYVVYGTVNLAAIYIDPELYATESFPRVREIISEKRNQKQVPSTRIIGYRYERATGMLSFDGPAGFTADSGVVVASDILGNRVPVSFEYQPAINRLLVTPSTRLLPRSLYLVTAISPEGSTTIKVWLDTE